MPTMLMRYVATLADRLFEKRTVSELPPPIWDPLYLLSLEELRTRANAGDGDAAFVLGDMHDQGSHGVGRDLSKAVEWYYHAEKLGHADAMNNLGSMNQHGDGPFEVDFVKAREYYEKSVAAGCGKASNNLGHFYANGSGGLDVDERKAFRLFSQGARRGDGDAMVSLGYRYDNGIGMRKRPIMALYWYRRARQADNPRGAHNLGVVYYYGTKVQPDPEKAVALLEESLAGGFERAAYTLGLAHEYGKGTERSLEDALYLYRRAESDGHTSAQEAIDRVLAKMGEELSTAFDPEQRLEDIRVLIRDPDRRFSVQALLLEVARIGEMLVHDKENPAADTPYVLGKSTLIRGFVLWKQQNPEYEGPVDTALMIDERHPFMTAQERISLLTAQAVALGRREKWDEAIAAHRRSLSLLQGDPQAEEGRVLVAMVDLAYCLHENGEFPEAQRLNSEVLARGELAYGEDSSRLTTVLANLAQNEFALGRPEQSVALLRRRLAIAERNEYLEVIDQTLRDLAIASFDSGLRDEAEELFRRRIAFAERNGDSRDVDHARRDLEEMYSRE
jgi:TPR repeat protein